MFAGHLAIAFALGRLVPSLALGTLLAVALLPDFAFGVLALAGVEGLVVSEDPAAPGAVVFDFPFSHSLAGGLYWSLLAYLAAWLLVRDQKKAVVLGGALLAHFLLDLVVHVGPLPVLGADSPALGLGLGELPALGAAIEAVLVAAALALYLTSRSRRQGRARRIALVVFIAVVAVAVLGLRVVVPAADGGLLPAPAWAGLPVIVAAVAYWLDPPERRIGTPRGPETFAPRLIALLTGRGRARRERPPEDASATLGEEADEMKDEDEEEQDLVWPRRRLELAEKVWGEGFITPGGAEYVLEFVQLLGLTGEKSLLDLSAGLGGPARAMSEDSGVWVTGLEASAELAPLGEEKSMMAGMSKRASVARFDPERPKLKKRGYNAVVSLEGIHTVADKEGLFKAIEEALRDTGFFLFTDFLLPRPEKPNQEVRRWMMSEPVTPHLWTVKQTTDFLGGLDFKVHVAEDVTTTYKAMVIEGWADFAANLTKADLTPKFTGDIFGECEYWARRLAALDSGGVRMFRYTVEKTKE